MNGTTLEKSIKQETEKLIAGVLEKEAAGIKRLDEEYTAEIEQFRKKTETETQARIDQELSRLENRAILERKKTKLKSVDRFLGRMVEEAVEKIRESPRYGPFLIRAAVKAAARIPGNLEVRLKPEDMARAEDIRNAVGTAGNRRVEIREDAGIGWGGCLVVDGAAGRVFNETLERRYFRNAGLIRRKAVKILQGAAGPTERKNVER